MADRDMRDSTLAQRIRRVEDGLADVRAALSLAGERMEQAIEMLTAADDAVRCQRLVVVDDAGRVRAAVGPEGIILANRDGGVAVVLGPDQEGSGVLNLCDSRGKTLASLGATSEGGRLVVEDTE